MPIIPPLSDELVSEDLRELFARTKLNTGSNNAVRTFAHNPRMLQDYLAYYGSIWKGSIDPKLKEMVRYRIAIAGECHY